MLTRRLTITDLSSGIEMSRSRLRLDTQWLALLVLLLASDALTTWASLSLAYSVRFVSGILAYTSSFDQVAYRRFALVSVPIWLIILMLLRLYDRDYLLGGVEEYRPRHLRGRPGNYFRHRALVLLARIYALIAWMVAFSRWGCPSPCCWWSASRHAPSRIRTAPAWVAQCTGAHCGCE